MRNILIAFLSILFLAVFSDTEAQSKKNDIPVSQLPDEVKAVLDEYVNILSSSETLDECADRFAEIAGGGLVNEAGDELRRDIKPYSLKKDYNNIKYYAQPIEITRVNKRFSNGDGYGESAIKGEVYKIWIDKKSGSAGMPAPISIMVPEDHEFIQTPKVIGIGSL